jgi:HTH-type transcriptional regulator, competence development regulator
MAESRFNIEVKALGKNIRKLRKDKGLTQIDLETITRISQNDLSKIENGLLDLQFSRIVRIAEALEVGTADLLRGHNSNDGGR